MSKKKVKSKKQPKAKWFPMPNRDFGYWFGEYMVSNIMMDAYVAHKKFPVRIKFSKYKELPDGGADIIFDVEF